MKTIFKIITLFTILLLAQTAQAATGARLGIAATVNDDVVTMSDVQNRLELYLSGSKGQPPADVVKGMQQQVLNKLIDERLQMQEAKSLGIDVTEEQIAGAFEQIAKQNNFTADEFKKRLTLSGVKVSSLYDQLRSEVAWGQVVRRKLRPQISISENEIDSALTQMSAQKGKMQYQVAEIMLPVPTPAEDSLTLQKIQALITRLNKGEPFPQIARNESKAPGAANGGDLGWVSEGQLDRHLDDVLKTLQPGQLSEPVRTDKGYHVLFLRNVRQAGITAAPAAAALGDLNLQSPPAANDETSRDAIANKIGRQRLDQMQDHYLRDLRASAFIEKRI